MKQYMNSVDADAFHETYVPVGYEYAAEGFDRVPQLEDVIDPTGEAAKARPSTAHALYYIGVEPKQILELGCGVAGDALWLAKAGHKVTAVDSPQATRWQANKAYDLGVHNNLTTIVGDARHIPKSKTYDVIIANMLIHFYDTKEADQIVRGMRAATALNGLNILSVYNPDNPAAEQQPPRNLRQFLSIEDLRAFYDDGQWQVEHEATGYSDGVPVDRSYFGENLVLIPSISSLIVRKIVEPAAQQGAAGLGGLFDARSTTSITLKI